MKRIGYIALLSAIILQTGGLILIFKTQQSFVKWKMVQSLKMKDSHFTKMIITTAEFQKLRINDHEISYNGKMYDFKSAVVKDQKVVMMVIRDSNEEALIEKIDELARNTNEESSSLPHQIIKLIALIYDCPAPENLTSISKGERKYFSPCTEAIPFLTREILSPPPKSV